CQAHQQFHRHDVRVLASPRLSELPDRVANLVEEIALPPDIRHWPSEISICDFATRFAQQIPDNPEAHPVDRDTPVYLHEINRECTAHQIIRQTKSVSHQEQSLEDAESSGRHP